MHVDDDEDEEEEGETGEEVIDLTSEAGSEEDDGDEKPEEWEADAEEVKRFLNDLGLFAGRSDVLKQEDIVAATERSDIRKLTRAMALVSKGARIQAKGLDGIAKIISRRPTLQPQAQILQPYGTVSVNPVSAPALLAIKEEGEASTSGVPVTALTPEMFLHPKRNAEGRFRCSSAKCGEETWGSWGACNSHIMRVHKKKLYGPCTKCAKFTSPNIDSFQKHEKMCGKKGVGKKSAK